jgi:hypothetical protein
VYREHEFVERCHCSEPAIGPYVSCGRARCALHLERGLCNRCTQWIDRELDKRTTGRWVGSGVLGTMMTLGMLVTGIPFGIVVALPLSVGAYFGMRGLQRKQLIARMGPALAASKGELPQPERKPDLPSNTTNSIPGAGW